MLLAECEETGRNMLAKAGVDSPGLCARLIMGHVACLDKLGCLLERERPLSAREQSLYFALCARRARGEPLAYILGKKEFYEHEFAVTPATLIPRPETELVVELALAGRMDSACGAFLDCGCGCGCIGLSLACAKPQWQAILLEKSHAAAQVAATNARIIAPAAVIILADIFHLPVASASVDLVVSNPPYISPAQKNIVMPGVLAYEPHMALFSEEDGLGHLRAVAMQAARVLRPGGWLVMEHGMDQALETREILRVRGFGRIETHADLAGLPRCVSGRKE